MSTDTVKFPKMRAEMLSYLNLISKLQRNQETPSATEDLEYIVHYFFDDTEIAKNPGKYIGVILTSKDEVLVVGIFGKLLDKYLENCSPGALLLRFEEGEEWKAVQTAAQQALNILKATKAS